jgi:hypothetical protein
MPAPAVAECAGKLAFDAGGAVRRWPARSPTPAGFGARFDGDTILVLRQRRRARGRRRLGRLGRPAAAA